MSRTNTEEKLSIKAIRIFSLIVSIFVVLFAALQLLSVWNKALNVCIPLLGVQNVCQAYISWNSNRKQAIASLVVAAFILIVCVIVFFGK